MYFCIIDLAVQEQRLLMHFGTSSQPDMIILNVLGCPRTHPDVAVKG